MEQPIYIAPSRIAGTGCYAARRIRRGEIIGEYLGEVLRNEVAYARYHGRDETYLFMVNEEEVIDGDVPWNLTKFINHSCEPNCGTRQEGKRIFFVAAKDIAEGEEISFDYKLEVEPWITDPCACNCRSRSCRGTMREITVTVTRN